MSTNVLVRPGGQTYSGGLNVYVGPARTPNPIIDVPVERCGTQSLIFGAAANSAGVDAAIAALATPSATDGSLETGFGRGASILVSADNPGSSTWVMFIAVSEELPSVPTSTLTANFALRGTTVDVNGAAFSVYTANGTATDESGVATVTFGGDAPWQRLGFQEGCEITEDGVSWMLNQTYNELRCLNRPGPKDITRVTEDVKVGFNINDMTVETLSTILDRATITHSANTGGVGWRRIPLARPTRMEKYAVVARGQLSPYVEGGNRDFWIPVAVQTASQTLQHTKSAFTQAEVEFTAIDDQAPGAIAGMGFIIDQDRVRANQAAA